MSDLSVSHTPPRDGRKTTYVAIALAVLFVAVGSIIGFLTGPAADGWYAGLTKSELTPPGWVFGVVWPILYVLIGVATALIWVERARPVARAALGIMALQLLLNYAWSYIFFTLHRIVLGFWWIVLIDFWVVILIALAWRVRRAAGILLLPYLAWLAFATYLAGTIASAN